MKTPRLLLSLCLSSFALAACGSDPADSGSDGDAPGGPSILPGQSGAFCELEAPELGALRPLDKELFVQTLADSIVGWMQPLHEALLPLDEHKLLETVMETVLGTYDTRCKPERDLEFLPPEDDLIDPEVQADVRQGISDLFSEAVVVPTGDETVLRLSLHECSSCGEPVGLEPSYLTARLTEDGVLALEYELTEGQLWTKHLYVTPDTLVVQGELAPLWDWGDTLSSDAREGRFVYPNGAGSLTAVVHRTMEGKLSASVGLAGFDLESADERPLRLVSTSPCLGVYGELDRAAGSASVGVYLGELDIEMPGSTHCGSGGNRKCTDAEYDGTFVYHAGDLAVSGEHPAAGQETTARFGFASGGQSTATAPGGTFGEVEFGPGDPEHDAVSVDLVDTPDGIRVVFQPALDLRAALLLSNLSDALRVDFPDWLSDEVFDLSFGGDPKPTLLVPHRAACSVDSSDVYRRLVEVEAGTVHGLVGDGRDESAEPGQCLGQTRRPGGEIEFTSDWVEVLGCE